MLNATTWLPRTVRLLPSPQGEPEDAHPLLQQALAIFGGSLGSNHPYVAMIRESLAEVRGRMHRGPRTKRAQKATTKLYCLRMTRSSPRLMSCVTQKQEIQPRRTLRPATCRTNTLVNMHKARPRILQCNCSREDHEVKDLGTHLQVMRRTNGGFADSSASR